MRNNFLQEAYGGLREARSKLNGLGLPRQWKVMTSTLLLLFTFAIGNVWAAAHSITPNKTGTNYEIYEIAHANNQSGTVIKTKTNTFNDDFAGWCSGAIYDYSGSVPTVPSGISANWLTQSTKGAKIRSTGITFEVTNCVGVTVLGKAAGTSGDAKKLTLSVKSGGDEVGTIASDWNTNVHELTYGSTLTASTTYTVTVASSGEQNCEFYQIRFEAPAATKYKVTYKAGDGTGDDVVDSDAKTVKAFADCSFTAPSGYEFKEWQDGSSNVVAAGATVSADMTLTAIYRLIPTQYTVTYSLNDASGDAPTETDKAAGDAFNLAAAPSWAGHAFDGWLCNIDSDVKAAGSSYTMTAAPTTFTAQWHELECKIYSFTGGIGSATAQTANATVDAEKMFVKDSGDKIRLTPATGESFKVGDILTFSGNLNNSAKKFGLKLYADGGSSLSQTVENTAGAVPMICSAALTFNADYIDIARADGTGTTIYTCEVHRACAEGVAAGLSYAETSVGKYSSDAAFINPLTNANNLVVVYGSSDNGVATVNANGQVTLVGVGTATITAKSAVQTKAGTLYAAGTASYTLTVAAPPTFAVTYDDNGGEGTMTDSNSPYAEGAEVTLLDNTFTAPSGYAWSAWAVTETVSGNPVAVSEGKFTMPGVAVTVTAQWALIADFDVKFFQGYDTNAQIGETQSISTNGNATAPTDPERDGYRFLGWSTDGTEANIKDIATYAITTATNFTAVWKQVWTVTFDGAGAVEVENGETVASPNSPVQAGKVFQGWYNAETKYDFSAAVAGNLALTSKWADADANHYVYAYNDDFHFDGVVYKTPEGKVDNNDLTSNKAITTPYTLFSGAGGITSIVATGAIYDSKGTHVNAFLKLDTKASSYLTVTIASGYTAVMKVKMGSWNVGSAAPTVTFVDEDDTPVSYTGTMDGKAEENSYAELTYNLSAGTYKMTTATKTLYFSNIDIEAEAIPAKTVTYHANNGTTDQTVDDAATAIADCSFSYSGHKFIGWNESAEGTGTPHAVNEVVATDLVLYAQWKEYFTITYKDGETTIGTEDVFTDATPAGIANPVKMGNNFAGWVDGENNPVTIASLNAATTVYAKWTAFDGCVELWPATSGEAPTAADEEIVLQSGSKGGRIVTVSAKSGNFNESFGYTANGLGLMKGGDDVIGVTLNNEIGVGTKISVTLYSNNEGERGLILQTATGGKVGSDGVTLGWATATLGAVETFTYTAEAGDGLVGTNGFRLKRNNTVYLKCLRVESCGESIIYHEVTYNMMGHGVAPANESVRENRLVTEPTAPEEAGYYFRGWYKENTFVNKWNFATDVMGTTDMTLYAKWEEDLCTDRQSIVKMVLTSPTEATVTGYNTKEYAGGFFTNNLNTGSGNTSAHDFGEGEVTGYKLAGTKSAVFATLAKGGFQEGDKVIIALTSAASSNKLEIYAAKDKDNTLLLGEVAAAAAGVYTYTITAANVTAIEAAGADYKSIGTIRGTYNPYVYSVELTGCRSWAIMHTLTFKNIDGSATIANESLAEGDFASTVAPTAPIVEDKRFIGWAETIDGTPVNLASYTITDDKTLYAVYGDCPTSGTVFKFTVATGKTNGNIFATTPNSMELTTENYLAELEGGSVVAAVSGSDNNRLQYYDGKALGFYSGSQGSLTLKLECPMEEGDLIRFINYENNNQKFSLKGDDHTETLAGNSAETVQTLSVPAEWDGLRELTLTRSNNTPKISYFEIYRRPVATGVSLADMTVREGASATPVMTLSPSADALVTNQAWSIISGDDKISINPTTGEVTGVAQGDAEIKVVLNENPAISATATVHVVESFVQQDVDESVVWDFSKAGEVSTSFTEQILANVDGVTLDAAQFNARQLVGTAQNITTTYFQGTMLTFNATKAGLLYVRFTNGNGNVRTLKVYAGDPEVEIASWSYSNAATEYKSVEVPAGKVTLRSFQGDAPNNVRVMKMEFFAENTARARTLAVGNLGTTCIENECIVRGAEIYAIKGKNEIGKIVFEELGADEVLEAGHPYVMVAKEANIRFFNTTAEPAPAAEDHGLIGTFAQQVFAAGEASNGLYFFKEHALWAAKETGMTIPAYRCYLDMTKVGTASPNPAPGRRRIVLGVQGEQVATGIDELNASETPVKVMIDGQLFIIRGEKMYNANGQLVK